jgi:ABC-type nitrate/sulfonate/bicarbonate transport system permease component
MKYEKATFYILPLIPIFLFFLFWEIFGSNDIIEVALFSKPSIIFGQLYKILPQLVGHLLSTLMRLGLSFFTALLLGISIGMMMGYNQYIYRFFNPLITTVMAIPGIAMAPVFIIWLGFGDPTIVTIGIIIAFFPIVYNAAMGVRSVDKNLVNAAKIMGARKKDIFLKVYLPHSLAHLIIGTKLGLARCWRTIIAVEFIAATSYGLGYMIWDAYEYLNVSIVYGGIIILAVLFFTIEKTIIRSIENKTIKRWGVIFEHE